MEQLAPSEHLITADKSDILCVEILCDPCCIVGRRQWNTHEESSEEVRSKMWGYQFSVPVQAEDQMLT